MCDGGAPYPPSCHNGTVDIGETDTDCGGQCPPCKAGRKCVVDCDCASGPCAGGSCT